LGEWHTEFKEVGLTVIGVHTPARDSEKDIDGLADLIPLLEIPYPVAADNERETWIAFNNHYLPSLYLIDRAGQLRFFKAGGRQEAEVEALLRALLAEPAG